MPGRINTHIFSFSLSLFALFLFLFFSHTRNNRCPSHRLLLTPQVLTTALCHELTSKQELTECNNGSLSLSLSVFSLRVQPGSLNLLWKFLLNVDSLATVRLSNRMLLIITGGDGGRSDLSAQCYVYQASVNST